MTIDSVRAECLEGEGGGIKGSIFDQPPSIDGFAVKPVRWDSETVDASLHRESFAGNVNRDMDVDKWGTGASLYSVATRCCSS